MGSCDDFCPVGVVELRTDIAPEKVSSTPKIFDREKLEQKDVNLLSNPEKKTSGKKAVTKGTKKGHF